MVMMRPHVAEGSDTTAIVAMMAMAKMRKEKRQLTILIESAALLLMNGLVAVWLW